MPARDAGLARRAGRAQRRPDRPDARRARGDPRRGGRGRHRGHAAQGRRPDARCPGADPARRPMADLDLLVRPGDRGRLGAVLVGLGYRHAPDGHRRPTHDVFVEPGGGGRLVDPEGEHPDNPRRVEVHVEVKRHLWGWADDDDLTAALWRGASRGEILGQPATLPRPESLLAHLAIHASSDLLSGRGRLVQWLDLGRHGAGRRRPRPAASSAAGLPVAPARPARPAASRSPARSTSAGLERQVPDRLARWAATRPPRRVVRADDRPPARRTRERRRALGALAPGSMAAAGRLRGRRRCRSRSPGTGSPSPGAPGVAADQAGVALEEVGGRPFEVEPGDGDRAVRPRPSGAARPGSSRTAASASARPASSPTGTVVAPSPRSGRTPTRVPDDREAGRGGLDGDHRLALVPRGHGEHRRRPIARRHLVARELAGEPDPSPSQRGPGDRRLQLRAQPVHRRRGRGRGRVGRTPGDRRPAAWPRGP